ncbi:MAG: hypothetical protein RLZZ597_976, partial [Cyanobacteriota bacterium]
TPVIPEVVETVPDAASATPEEKADSEQDDNDEAPLTPAEAKQAFPETKVIPPQAEPLVGPLGSAEDGVSQDTEAVALGQAADQAEAP